ncbi:MAG: cyclic nucleotide-binding domain-containing protein [Nitrospirae bacterium]|nr:cyclic nucleotide-binding domain-containing protein [Nitrospirota bacterium]
MINLSDESLAAIKNDVSVFHYLSMEELRTLAAYFKIKKFPAQSLICKEGDICNEVVFILSGSVEEKKATEFKDKEIVFGVYKKGAIIGFTAMPNGTVSPVTIIALQDSSIIKISRDDFDEVVKKYPELGIKLMKGMLFSLAKRLTSSYERITSVF